MKNQNQRFLQILISYYGILQSLHLLTLLRAGLLMLAGQKSPFPILPPPAGWNAQTLPFLFGLAGTDIVGILLGIVFASRAILKKQINAKMGLLSLTIFIIGAVVFGAGTFPSGAWGEYPAAYWIMVVLFIPAVILYIKLLSEPPMERE